MIEKLKIPELAVCDYGDTDRIIDHIICLGKKINEIIDHLSQEKDCRCNHYLKSTEGCPVHNKTYKPTKEVPDMRGVLEKWLKKIYKSFDILYIAKEDNKLIVPILQEISKLMPRVVSKGK